MRRWRRARVFLVPSWAVACAVRGETARALLAARPSRGLRWNWWLAIALIGGALAWTQ